MGKFAIEPELELLIPAPCEILADPTLSLCLLPFTRVGGLRPSPIVAPEFRFEVILLWSSMTCCAGLRPGLPAITSVLPSLNMLMSPRATD